jgi:transposase
MAPLFEPLCEALMERHLTERLFHGDETRWKVFQEVEGKVGHRWYLWLTRSASVVFFWMAPGRGADEIKAHLSELNRDVTIIFVCDRYKAYQRHLRCNACQIHWKKKGRIFRLKIFF